jgi:hypothetical protein
MCYDNDAYLEEVFKRTLYLMMSMLTAWGKINKKRNLHVWPKGKDMCWYPLDKVIALTRSPAAIPGTKDYFMDIGQ